MIQVLKHEWRLYPAWAGLIGPSLAFCLRGEYSVEAANATLFGSIIFMLVMLVMLAVVKITRTDWRN